MKAVSKSLMCGTLLKFFWISVVRQRTPAVLDCNQFERLRRRAGHDTSLSLDVSPADAALGQHNKVTSQCFDEWEEEEWAEANLSSTHKRRYSLDFFAESAVLFSKECCLHLLFVSAQNLTYLATKSSLFPETCYLQHTLRKLMT